MLAIILLEQDCGNTLIVKRPDGKLFINVITKSAAWARAGLGLTLVNNYMNLQEFQSLRKYAYAEAKYRSFFSISRKSKRSVRGKAKGVGQILKHSKVIPQVNMETLFIKRD